MLQISVSYSLRRSNQQKLKRKENEYDNRHEKAAWIRHAGRRNQTCYRLSRRQNRAPTWGCTSLDTGGSTTSWTQGWHEQEAQEGGRAMILYVCPTCGAWYLSLGLAEAFAAASSAEIIQSCRECRGE